MVKKGGSYVKDKNYISKKSVYDKLIDRDKEMICRICNKSLENEISQYLTWRAFGRKTIKRTNIDLDIDHKIPYWLVGGDKWADLSNLHIVHKTCNKKKGGNIVVI